MFEARIPVATYRLQFNNQLRFEDARGLVPYLYKLGVSDLYASPVFKARQGSLHGYDVTDPTCLNPELGTETDFESLVDKLREHNMGLLLDIVPNHMAASPENPWWRDILNKGQESPYAAFFDLDWLAFGETGSNTTGYRRFFDIGDLVGVRVENPAVFEVIHSLLLRLVAEGKITGLRVDHIDGLYDPFQYLSRLQQSVVSDKEEASTFPRFYTVVEKILSGDEPLPEEWPVFGTTGYDFTNMVNAFFVDSRGAHTLDEIYSRFIGSQVAFNDVVYEKKKQVMEQLFPGEVYSLGQYLNQLAQQDRHTVDLSSEELTEAITEVTACLPVYRTYTRNLEVSPRDKLYLENAVDEAKRRNPNIDGDAINFLRRIFTMDLLHYFDTEQKTEWLSFVLRWQQLTGAIMAKGFEDTALYSYNRLISLNEVGGKPDSPGLSVDDFHKLMQARRDTWPYTLNATSTHDTKRSEDVRARINVLSEIPEECERRLTEWSEWNLSKKPRVNGLDVPEPNTEIFLYQTLIGAWPLYKEEVANFKERLKAYMLKAVREAKVNTSWLSPNSDYESSLTAFVGSILENSKNNYFIEDFLRFEKKIAFYGALNSLAQVLLKITSPGVPDFYQGTELWNLSLVDPDNRRPVDFEARRGLLDEIIQQESKGQEPLIEQILNSWEDGRVKLYLTYKALNARKSYSDLFQDGEYIPLQVEGQRQEHVCAFARNKGDNWALTVVPRLMTRLVNVDTFPCGQQVWADNHLLLPESAPESWLNIFTGQKHEIFKNEKGFLISDILNQFPIALLIGGR